MKTTRATKKMSVFSAAAMGIGAMVGAGIFALLGEATRIAGNLIYIPFIIAGLVSLLLGYSYSKLGVKYPSMGGPVEYLIQGFGTGIPAGAFNILYCLAILSGSAMLAKAFGNYAAALMPEGYSEEVSSYFTSGVILLFTLLNFIGAKAVGNVEKWIVSFKVSILLLFSFLGVYYLDPQLLIPKAQTPMLSVLNATGIVFFAFTGFGLVTNTVQELKNPAKDLPRAIFISIGTVMIIYLLICFALVGNLSYQQIVDAREYALAEAAKPILGNTGFKIMAVAAVLSTASAINASLFGVANISYIIARKGELPEFFERKLWKNSTEGLLICAGIILIMANFLQLNSIASVGSAIILLIYVLVNIGHLRLASQTGARRWLIWMALLSCSAVLGYLLFNKFQHDPLVVYLFLAAIGLGYLIEWFMQRIIGRKLQRDFRADGK